MEYAVKGMSGFSVELMRHPVCGWFAAEPELSGEVS